MKVELSPKVILHNDMHIKGKYNRSHILWNWSVLVTVLWSEHIGKAYGSHFFYETWVYFSTSNLTLFDETEVYWLAFINFLALALIRHHFGIMRPKNRHHESPEMQKPSLWKCLFLISWYQNYA